MPLSNDIEIGFASGDPDEARAIARLHLQVRLAQIMAGRNTFSNLLDSQYDLGNLNEYYLQGGGAVVRAKSKISGAIVGCCGIKIDDQNPAHAFIKRMGVAPDRQRQGIGKAIFDTAIDWMNRHKIEHASLTTSVTEDARPIYEDAGFVVVGKEVMDATIESMNAFCMRLQDTSWLDNL